MGLLDGEVFSVGGEITEDQFALFHAEVMKPPAPREQPGIEDGGILYAFSADEIMDLRKHLLPNRMAHHDNAGDKRLRQHVSSIQERRGKKRMD